MSQQINLLNPALRPRQDPLSLDRVTLAAVLVLMVLVALGSWGRQREAQALEQFKRQEAQLKAAQAQLVELAGLQAKRQIDPALELEVAGRKTLLANKEQVLALLEQGELGQPRGFAVFMEALARQTPEGLWLTGFDLQGGGKTLLLQGGLLAEPVLPVFVQRLNQEESLRGLNFAALKVEQAAPLSPPASGEDGRSALERSGYLKFSLEGAGLQPPVEGSRP